MDSHVVSIKHFLGKKYVSVYELKGRDRGQKDESNVVELEQ